MLYACNPSTGVGDGGGGCGNWQILGLAGLSTQRNQKTPGPTERPCPKKQGIGMERESSAVAEVQFPALIGWLTNASNCGSGGI